MNLSCHSSSSSNPSPPRAQCCSRCGCLALVGNSRCLKMATAWFSGYDVIAPVLRGYEPSSSGMDVGAYTLEEIAGDVLSIIQQVRSFPRRCSARCSIQHETIMHQRPPGRVLSPHGDVLIIHQGVLLFPLPELQCSAYENDVENGPDFSVPLGWDVDVVAGGDGAAWHQGKVATIYFAPFCRLIDHLPTPHTHCRDSELTLEPEALTPSPFHIGFRSTSSVTIVLFQRLN